MLILKLQDWKKKVSHLTPLGRVIRQYLTKFKICIIFYKHSTSRNFFEIVS